MVFFRREAEQYMICAVYMCITARFWE